MTTRDDGPGSSSDTDRAASLRELFDDDGLDERELVELRAVADLGATLDRHDLQPPPPPGALFDDVLRRARATTDPVDDELRTIARQVVRATTDPVTTDQATTDQATTDRTTSDVEPVATVVALAPRRRRALAAVAAVAAVVLGAVLVLPGDADPFDDAVALDPLAEDVAGRAVVEGDQVLLDAELPPLADGAFYEVWLLDEDVETLVSLGALRSDGVLAIPQDADLRITRVLDVSIEEPDGDPSHSGRSVLRGELEA